ncbi:MAG: IS630 family transposase [Vicinamibacterales bacterium]
MPNHAVVLELSDADEGILRERVRAKSLPAREIERARIVLLAAEGIPADEIAQRVGCSRPTVVLWRSRYASAGINGLVDDPRSGGPKRLPQGIQERIVAKTLKPPPKRLGVTHWSSRLLAREIGCSYVFITKVWRAHGLKPHRTQTFKFSTDPDLEAKIEDIVGLYLFPPENAIVLCVDEKSQIQALERTQPILPLRPGLPARATHDYRRNGTATLFAALEVATGRVTDRCFDKHRHQEFLAFLKQVAAAYPRRELHIVVDNYGTHKHPVVRAWLERHPRIQLHFTPKGASWLNMVETFFSIITRQAIRRGSFGSVKELVATIRRFIDVWNERCEPFVWTKDLEELLAAAKRQTGMLTDH